MSEFPVSLDVFKNYFLREAGLEYQPYPSWVKTTWDKGDWCLFENVFYQSDIDYNHEIPSPDWTVGSYVYEAGTAYKKGSVVYYEETFYIAQEDTNTIPTSSAWTTADVDILFPNWRPWAEPKAYAKDESVIAVVNYKVGVWTSQADDNYTDPMRNPLIPDEEVNYWEEDEDATEELSDVILDADILRAMGEASFKFNPSLFSKERGEVLFLYLTMFFLVYDRQMASAGMNGNSAAGPVIHRTVGKMTVSYAESKLFSKYPSYEFLASNDYGRKAFNLMAPYLRGGVRILRGGSTAE